MISSSKDRNPLRLLFVDDEPSILITLSAILRQHGFDVTAQPTVADALHSITNEKFDILLTDLNIGQPGDGFTVVSAMRRTQPDATTVILTGYPAFDSALEAIRQQVDEYLVKPVTPDTLLSTLSDLGHRNRPHKAIASKRISTIVRDEKISILDRWLQKMRLLVDEDGSLNKLSDEELVDHLPDLLDELSRCVDEHATELSTTAKLNAVEHGRTRTAQGFGPILMMYEGTLVRQSVLEAVHHNLLLLNLSYLFTDLAIMSDCLDAQLRFALEARLSTTKTPEVVNKKKTVRKTKSR